MLVLAWIAAGSLEGNVDFFLRLNNVAAYVGSDQNLDGMLSRLSFTTPNANTMIAMIPFLVLGAGLVQGFLGRGPGSVAASRILLAASGCSLIFLERSLVRPNDLMYYLPLVAFSCAAILLWDRRATVAAVLTGAFAGALLAGLQFNEGLQGYLSSVGGTPVRTVDSLIYASRPEARRYAREDAVAFRKFQNWPEAQMARQLQAAAGSERPSFAVLGDSPILYVWFRQRPPYHVNLYDSAPAFQQREMIERLERMKPTYLVWDRDSYAVDGVPYIVRDPLIFTYVIDNYVPVQFGKRNCPPTLPSCGAADILKRRDPSQKIPFDYWLRRFGRQVDLGFVPVYADPPGKRCDGGGPCASYAVVRGHASFKGEQVQLVVSGRRGAFGVLMRVRPGAGSYTVRLDRLWFWPFLGPQATVASTNPSWSVDRYEGESDDRLY